MNEPATPGMPMRTYTGAPYRFDPGALCLELLTTGGPGPFSRYEALHTPADLAAWAERSRLTPTPVLNVSDTEVADARRLRDALFRTAIARTTGALPAPGGSLAPGGSSVSGGSSAAGGALAPGAPSAPAESLAPGGSFASDGLLAPGGVFTLGDLDVLNEFAARPPLAPAIGPDGERRWAGPADGGRLLATVARDAVELLTGPFAHRVRMCEAEDCYLVYVDTSRPGRRRWCSMDNCGNRHKVRALRARRAEGE